MAYRETGDANMPTHHRSCDEKGKEPEENRAGFDVSVLPQQG
ncbi:hypothetical protein [Allocoleopsis franciscana]|nr:hypothetical protein [Allocoleopsis franciscana]